MRILDTHSQQSYPLIKTKRPRRSAHFGRVWDCDRIVLNGTPSLVWRDFQWGAYNYLELDGQWYKFVTDATDHSQTRSFTIQAKAEVAQ